MRKRVFTYPGSDLDRGKALVAVLGSFWSRVYAARDQLQSYTTASATLAAQNYRNILETVWSLSRFDIPVFHRQYWVPIVIRKSDLTPVRAVNYIFNKNDERFDVTSTRFDGPTADDYYYFAAPPRLAGLKQIFNKIVYPTVALIENVDYIVDQKTKSLVFVENLFDNPGFLKRQAAVNGKPDEEIVLWGFNGDFDYENVFNQFAYAIGLRLKSSQNFKDLTNAVIDGLVSGGATCADLDLAFSAICGIPLVLETEETIEIIDNDTHGLFVATDKNLYRFGPDAEAVVKPGQKVRAGDQLIRGFDIDEFFVGSTYDPLLRDGVDECCPAPATVLATNALNTLLTETDDALLLDPNEPSCTPRKALAALALDNGFLSACFYGDLVFENKDVPLIVDTDHPSGFTHVSFKLGGLPQDVKQFFDDIHGAVIKGFVRSWPPAVIEPGVGDVWVVPDPRPTTVPPIPAEFKENDGAQWTGTEWRNIGVVRGARQSKCAGEPAPKCTLAHYLDRRKNPTSEPEAIHLPTTINPLRFIVENSLRNNVFVVKLTVSALGRNRLGLYNIRHLRQLLPPGTAMILVFDLAVPLNKIKGPDKIHEDTQFFIGAEPLSDTVDESFIQDLGVTVNLFSGSCQ